MKVVAIVQARMGSMRLPNKVMKLINEKPMIELLLQRLSKSNLLNEIVVATSTNENNTSLVKYLQLNKYNYFQGSENDVLNRYFETAVKYEADIVVRITGDCPLVDVGLVDEFVSKFLINEFDYISNTIVPTFPDGLDIEVFSFEALKIANERADDSYDREHVTPFIKKSKIFNTKNIRNKVDLSFERWTVDEIEDFNVIKNVFDHFHPNIHFTWNDIYELLQNQPSFFFENKKIIRNQGAIMNQGQKLWNRAKKVIPGGNMLLSKRPEMFLPEKWPVYFSKSKGCKVWDLDGNEFIDISLMGVGTNILGYGNDEVDCAVLSTISSGNMSSLNCPEEVFLAEKLVEMHPWAGMVRFTRTGGEANALAIRIGRAASGKEKVAICGYHGWHDWYLAANLNEKDNLTGHLMPGLDPLGVPDSMRGITLPFNYNDIDALELLLSKNDVGVIMMEVSRNFKPENDFLTKVRKLADKHHVILIFDECSSGFRQTFGGLHKLYNVEPDIAMFGKAIGNGYAINAVIGKTEVMQFAQQTFISSTFWTERIGPTAALKTLEVMQREKSWEIITKKGRYISDQWNYLAHLNELEIEISGIPALTTFNFKSEKALFYKTLISQELLKKGFLASNTVYSCTEHSSEIIENYLFELSKVFKLIKECELGRDVLSLLDSPVCHSGFKRLN